MISNIKLTDVILVKEFVNELDSIANKYCVQMDELIEMVNSIDQIRVPCVKP